MPKPVWNIKEKQQVEDGIRKYGWGHWKIIAESIPTKDRKQTSNYAYYLATEDPAWRARIVKAYDDNEEKVLVSSRPAKPNITKSRYGNYMVKIQRNWNTVYIGSYTTKERAEQAYHITSKHYEEWLKTNPNPTKEDAMNTLVTACDLARNDASTPRVACSYSFSCNVTAAELEDINYGPCYTKYERNKNHKRILLCRVINCQKFKAPCSPGCCRVHGKLFKRKYPGGEHQWANETGGEIIDKARKSSSEVVDVQPILDIPKKSIPLKIREVLTRHGQSGEDATGMTMDEIKKKVKGDYPKDKYSDSAVEKKVKKAVNQNKVGSRMSKGGVTKYFLILHDEDAKNKATSPQDKATNSKMAATTGKASGTDSKKKTGTGMKKASRGTKRKYDSDDDEEGFHSDMLSDSGDEEDGGGEDDDEYSLDNGDEDNDGNMNDSSDDKQVMSQQKAANDRAERMKRRQSGIPSQHKPPNKRTPKKKKTVPPPKKEEEEEEEAAPDLPLSEYEKYRLEKIARNKAKLAALGL